jgi:protein-tyrosine phosphatase
MLGFFKKNTESQKKSEIKTDMHSHLIPGIDDGVKTMDEALYLIKEMHQLGYERIITSPHIRFEIYENTKQSIEEAFKELRNKVQELQIQVEIACAAEYFVDEAFIELMKNEPLLTIGENKFLLIEFSHFSPPMQMKTVIFDLQSMGYRVILAHPERYFYYHQQFEKYIELIDRGVMLQLNLGSITGFYDSKVAKIAEKLIMNGLYTFVGTDIHNQHYLKSIQKALNHKLYPKIFEHCSIYNDEL